MILSVKQGDIEYHFWVFGMIQPGIELRSPGPLVHTLTNMPMGQLRVLVLCENTNCLIQDLNLFYQDNFQQKCHIGINETPRPFPTKVSYKNKWDTSILKPDFQLMEVAGLLRV